MPELNGQRHVGSPMSERDCFVEAIGHIRGLRDCLRGLALLRNDQRWLLPVRVTERLEDSVKRMMTSTAAKLLILPQREGRWR
jgi:hypothetical protein